MSQLANEFRGMEEHLKVRSSLSAFANNTFKELFHS